MRPTQIRCPPASGRSARRQRSHVPLAAMTDAGQTVTQLRVPDKTSEISCFASLLAPFDLAGATVPADALHAQRGHARFLVEDKQAYYALTVKKNRAGLYERPHSLPSKQVRTKFYDPGEGHDRKEARVVQALTVDDLNFPHVAQVARVVRHRSCLKTGRRSRETAYVVTDLTSRQASPQRLTKIIRSRWTVENRLRFVRDTTFARTHPRSTPATARRTWPPSAASRSTNSAPPDTRTSPQDSGRCPTSRSPAPWPSSDWPDPLGHMITQTLKPPWEQARRAEADGGEVGPAAVHLPQIASLYAGHGRDEFRAELAATDRDRDEVVGETSVVRAASELLAEGGRVRR
ncbi:ISAs1 family transposase [Streptomyces phaeochromogenes]